MFDEIMYCFRNDKGSPSVFPNSTFNYLEFGEFVFTLTPVVGDCVPLARMPVDSLVAITTDMQEIAKWLKGKTKDEELRSVIQRG